MGTKIEWANETLNLVNGCTQVSPGCANCYITRTFPMRSRDNDAGKFMIRDGKMATLIVTFPERLDQPGKWRDPRLIFLNSMGDTFHEDLEASFIADMFLMMESYPRHTFQVLTKRPERAYEFLSDNPDLLWPLRNVWLGTSVENQTWAERRIEPLIETPATTRFLSCEPLLRPLDLTPWMPPTRGTHYDEDTIPHGRCDDPHECDCRCPGCDAVKPPRLHWVIIGGESGPGARPLDLDWIRDIIKQCDQAQVPVFVKQLGSAWRKSVGSKSYHGSNMEEWPEDLRRREWPFNWATWSHRGD